MFDRIATSPSRSFFTLVLAFLAGIIIHIFDEQSWGVALFCDVLGALCVVCGFVMFRWVRCRLLLWVIAAVLFGIGRVDTAVSATHQDTEVSFLTENRFKGRVAEESRVTTTGTILIMDRVFVVEQSSTLEKAMELHLRLPFSVQRGDVLQWQCKPFSIPPTDENRFVLQSIGWQCFLRAPPVILAREPWWHIFSLLSFCRQSLRMTVEKLFPEPEGSLLLGLLIGERGGIPKAIVANFRNTGTSHILAVSGYNVTQLIEVIILFFASFSLPRRRASFLAAFVLLGFIVLVGAGASVMRAGIMGCAGLLAALYGRRSVGISALLSAAAIMLAANPLILRHDVGFQLSFAGVLGLHFLGPPLIRTFSFLPSFFGLRKICAETMAATIATTPLILFTFGTLPLIGPLINILIVPIVPLVMSTGALAIIVNIIPFPFAMIPALVTIFFLRFMEFVVSIGSSLATPFLLHITAPVMAFLYFWVIVLWFALYYRLNYETKNN